MAENLERQLTQRAFEYAEECKTFGYNPSIFINMLRDRGGLLAIKHLFNARKPSDGFTRLWEEERLDLSMEALVLENKQFHALFSSEELDKARKWLKEYEYQVKE